MRVSITGSGLLDPARFRAWQLDRFRQNRDNVRKGMLASSAPLKEMGAAAIAGGLKITRTTLPRAISRTKLWDQKPNELPALQFFFDKKRAPWINIQTFGGTISGKTMIIPALPPGKRIGRKAFRQLLAQLRSFLFYKKQGDVTLVFAEKPARKDTIRGLAPFARNERAKRGVKTLKAGSTILIGTMVSSVQLRARIDWDKLVEQGRRMVVRNIQAAGA